MLTSSRFRDILMTERFPILTICVAYPTYENVSCFASLSTEILYSPEGSLLAPLLPDVTETPESEVPVTASVIMPLIVFWEIPCNTQKRIAEIVKMIFLILHSSLIVTNIEYNNG